MVSRSGTEDGLARNILENVSLSNIARLYIQIKVEHFTGCHFEIFASYCIIFAETLVFLYIKFTLEIRRDCISYRMNSSAVHTLTKRTQQD